MASDTPAYIEGAHADEIFYLFDESKSIIAATFDAAEGAFSGGEGTRAFALSTSTPGEPNGRFYEIQTQKPGLEDWHPIHVSLERAVAAGRVSQAWADQRALQWGRNSALRQPRARRVPFRRRGRRHPTRLDRGGRRALEGEPRPGELRLEAEDHPLGRYVGKADGMGVDVARQGEDKTIFALRHGNRICELREYFHADTMETAGNVAALSGIRAAPPSTQTGSVQA